MIYHFIQNFTILSLLILKKWWYLKWISRYSKRIYPGDVVIDYHNDSVDPFFFKIKYFILDSVNGLLIFTEMITNFVYFDPHVQSFCVSDFDCFESSEWKLF